MTVIHMEIDSLRRATRNDEWVILLKEKSGHRLLPICVGSEQGETLSRALMGRPLDESAGDFRFLPHVFSMLPMVESSWVIIDRLEQNAFSGTLALAYRGSRKYEIELSAATAIALGIQTGAHISVDESLLQEVGIPVSV